MNIFKKCSEFSISFSKTILICNYFVFLSASMYIFHKSSFVYFINRYPLGNRAFEGLYTPPRNNLFKIEAYEYKNNIVMAY